jgi:hypothetical protein
MTTYVCGNSHVAALADGAGALADLTIFPLGNGRHEPTAFSRRAGDSVELVPEQYTRNVERYTGAPVISPGDTWGLLNVNHNVRIYRDDMWHRFRPSALTAADGLTPVSEDLLAAMVLRDQRGVRSFLTQLQDVGVDVFAISAPHPRQDGAAVRRGIPRDVIAHIDREARRLWREWLGGRGIALVEPPPETVTADGFLESSYGAGPGPNGGADPHHANAAYGALMLARIRAHLASR